MKESTQREDRQRLEYTYSSNEGYRETQSAATQSERQSAERKTARSKHTKDPVFESIPTRYLLQADAILQFMKLESISSTKSISVSDPSLDKDRNQQEEFSRVLGLRLGLSEQQQMEFTQLLLQNFDERKSYEAQPGPPAHAVYAKIKNKAFPRYHMALEIMKDKGILSAPQEEVREKMSREFREVEEKHFDVYKEGITPARWENNSQIRANLDQMLTPDQREELQAYVEEKQIKQREALVIQRRDIISQQLGLSIEEEQVIEQFLKEQPNASKEAISELLSPELAEIYLGEESSDK